MKHLLFAIETRVAQHDADQDDEVVEGPKIGFLDVEILVVSEAPESMAWRYSALRNVSPTLLM
jgi:hypothetical protein